MSNNILLEKDFNKVIVTNIFSSLIQSEKWDMLVEMFKLSILDINLFVILIGNYFIWNT